MEISIERINAASGLPGGRKLERVTRDDRSIPAIGVDNLRGLAALKRHGLTPAEDVKKPVGVAHAQDLVHLVAQAIRKAAARGASRRRTAMN